MTKLPKTAQEIINSLEKNGYQAYAVGGSVRDLLMKKGTNGWDFTTNAKPEEILNLFPDSFYDNSFGTVGIKIYNDELSAASHQSSDEIHRKPIDIYEVTTYRSEDKYDDLRHPDKISWGKSLEEDLSRRDFTINAIAYNGEKIIDPYDGQKDLKNKIIRTVGAPDKRFGEDALRIMRAVRIASELGFMIEEKTLTSVKKHAKLISSISAERVRDELFKILKSPYPADGILLLKSSNLLSQILPELNDAFQVGQKSPKRHHIYDVGTHSVMALKHCPSTDPIVRLATLLHDIGKVKTVKKTADGVVTFYNHEIVSARMAKNIARRFRMSRNQTDLLYTLVRWHQFSVDERQTDSAIRRIIRRVGIENLENMLALRIGDRLGGGARETSWRLELFKKRLKDVQVQPFSIPDLKVNGQDVMDELGIKPGPKVGIVLNEIFKLVDEDKLSNERKILMEKISEFKS
ncbi:CCA tRNA nucleotidyltransferase [Patescibacteria group bacterium]